MNIESASNKQLLGASFNLKQSASAPPEKVGKFEDTLFQVKAKEVEEKMTSMMDTIEKLKATLEYDMSVENLMDYKKALTSFIDYYTKHELHVQDVLMTDRKGYTKKLQIVKTINEKLNDMTSNMLETHLGHLQMLKEVGEIQGLVLNLFL